MNKLLCGVVAVAVGFVIGCGGSGADTADATTGDPAGGGGATSTSTHATTGSTTSSASTTSVATTGAGGDGATGGSSAGGAAPARADAPAIACADSITNVYVTPTGLPSMTDALRGDVVRCSKDSDVALADVAAEVLSKGVTTTMTSPVAIYRIAFRTERGDGSAGVSTARVYLPQAPAALPLPVIAIGHPTDGIADSCAPSEDATSNEDLALPWAGLGYAVIVPDYAGLGNEGVQSYLDNRDQAHAVLDGARALRAMLSPGALSTQVLAVGYSQGGGAVMSAQALASTYGAGGDLVGAIVFAPEWPTRLNSFGYVDQLENPDELTIETGISEDVVTVMRTYGWAYNALGEAHATDGFPSAQRSGFESAINSLCQTPLGGYLQGTAYTVGGIFDDSFRTSVLACVNSSGADPGCVDPGKSYYEYLVANFVTSDPNGAKVLYVQGLADYIMPAASEAACNLEKLANDGVTPTVCVDAAAQHQTVVGRNMDFALEWGFALLRGEGLPTCSSDGMPTCQP